MPRNPYNTQSEIRPVLESTQERIAELGPRTPKNRQEFRRLQVEESRLQKQLRRIIRQERGRLRADARFLGAMGVKLPVGEDEMDLALGAILGEVRRGVGTADPFGHAFRSGLF